jgi:hypothetical protein
MRVTVVATGLTRPLEAAASAMQSPMARNAPGMGHGPGSSNLPRGGSLRESPPQSILRQTAFQAAVQAAAQSPRVSPAPRQPASNSGEDANRVLTTHGASPGKH